MAFFSGDRCCQLYNYSIYLSFVMNKFKKTQFLTLITVYAKKYAVVKYGIFLFCRYSPYDNPNATCPFYKMYSCIYDRAFRITFSNNRNTQMHSSANSPAPPNTVDFLWFCDKVYHKQEVCFLLYFLCHNTTWQYNPNLLD